MIAFMKYDLFPFVLWAKVVSVEINPHTKQEILTLCNYGRYDAKSLLAILPDEAGQKAIEAIEAVTQARKEKLAKLEIESLASLNAAIPWK